MSKPTISDGTFDPVKKLKGYDNRKSQLYQFSTKFDHNNRTFTYVLGQFLCKDRTITTYLAIFDFLKSLYEQHFPDGDPFYIKQFHSDYENAFISAALTSFPGTQLCLCVFHFSHSVLRHLSEIMPRPTTNALLSEV